MHHRHWIITLLLTLSLAVTAGLATVLAMNWSKIATEPSSNKNSSTTTETKSTTRPIILYYIAISDNGQNGQKIGCDDSAVPVVVAQVETEDIVKSTFVKMLSSRDRNYDGSMLYNALYNSSLNFVSSKKTGNTIQVNLNGDFNLGGVCDTPRVQAQLELAAKTAANVKNAEIFVDSKPLSEVFSLR